MQCMHCTWRRAVCLAPLPPSTGRGHPCNAVNSSLAQRISPTWPWAGQGSAKRQPLPVRTPGCIASSPFWRPTPPGAVDCVFRVSFGGGLQETTTSQRGTTRPSCGGGCRVPKSVEGRDEGGGSFKIVYSHSVQRNKERVEAICLDQCAVKAAPTVCSKPNRQAKKSSSQIRGKRAVCRSESSSNKQEGTRDWDRKTKQRVQQRRKKRNRYPWHA